MADKKNSPTITVHNISLVNQALLHLARFRLVLYFSKKCWFALLSSRAYCCGILVPWPEGSDDPDASQSMDTCQTTSLTTSLWMEQWNWRLQSRLCSLPTISGPKNLLQVNLFNLHPATLSSPTVLLREKSAEQSNLCQNSSGPTCGMLSCLSTALGYLSNVGAQLLSRLTH